jgi:hypothetical protein
VIDTQQDTNTEVVPETIELDPESLVDRKAGREMLDNDGRSGYPQLSHEERGLLGTWMNDARTAAQDEDASAPDKFAISTAHPLAVKIAEARSRYETDEAKKAEHRQLRDRLVAYQQSLAATREMEKVAAEKAARESKLAKVEKRQRAGGGTTVTIESAGQVIELHSPQDVTSEAFTTFLQETPQLVRALELRKSAGSPRQEGLWDSAIRHSLAELKRIGAVKQSMGAAFSLPTPALEHA